MKISLGLISAIIVAMVFATAGISFAGEKDRVTDTGEVSVIFTHDMHSHMDADRKVKDGKIIETGGFAKLKTVMDEVKKEYPATFAVDAGDFAMGTPYQTIYSTEASELKMMKFIGFDATTFGNHEFDYRAGGLTSMLKEAKGNGPLITASNIDWESTFADKNLAKDAKALKEACDSYGVKDYIIIERNGIKMALFGLLGESAVDYAPESGLLFKDANEAATEVVEKIKSEENPDIIVCLSHCGTVENEDDKMEETEDYLLAENVPDIDLIISGHSHTRLDEPVQVGSTYIVSCGSYNGAAGHIVLEKNKEDKYNIKDFELLELDENVAPSQEVNKELSKYRAEVDKQYFNSYGYNAADVITVNNIEFPVIEEFGLVQGEEPLGNLVADSYKYAVAQAEKGTIKGYKEGGVASGEVVSDSGGAQITVIPHGVIRGSLIKGEITVADAFNISSLGYGKDGLAGYPLVRAYLTGKELKAAAEVDASVSTFMGVARLYSSGIEYSWNPKRLILNRAVDVRYNDGTSVKELENDKLYSVVADLYSCQMLGTVKDQSMGLLKIEPKDKDGKPITDFEEHIIYDGDKEVKAWYALASYIDSFEGDKIPEYYGRKHERKTEIDSLNPVELFKQPNNIAAIAAGVVIGIILIVCLIIVLVKKRRKHL